MTSGKPTIIEMSYKLLFLIYAPVTLVSYILNAVGGFEIGFLLIFLLSVSAISIVLALILTIRFAVSRKEIVAMRDINQNAPFLFRHDFLIPYILISIVSFTALTFMVYQGFTAHLSDKKSRIAELKKTEIVLILGLSDAHDYDDRDFTTEILHNYGASEIAALGHYLKTAPEHGNDYDFQLIDHRMQYSRELESQIVHYLRQGARYFICTTSAIAVPLSENFRRLVEEAGAEDNKPVLICTNAASPKIRTRTNQVYRFYIRSQEEPQVLTDKGSELGLQKAVFIAVDSEYGKGAVEAFREQWRKQGGTVAQGLFLDPVLSKKNIVQKIIAGNLLQYQPDVIFIANSNKGLVGSIEALDSFPDDIVILATADLSVKFTQVPIQDILRRKTWFTCVPDMKARDDYVNFDIYTAFLAMTIGKLTHTIETLQDNPGSDFHEIFTASDYPPILNFHYYRQGDFIIEMRIDSTLLLGRQ